MILALLPLLILGSAPTGSTWGFAVYQEDGTFVTSRWPAHNLVTVGSAPSNDLRLPKLRSQHATILASDGAIRITSAEEISVNGQRTLNLEAKVAPGDDVRIGVYRFQFLRADEEEEEIPIGDGKPIVASGSGSESGDGSGAGSTSGGGTGGVAGEPEAIAGPIDPKAIVEKAIEARVPEFKLEAYRFCHDPEFGKKGTDGVDFCAIFDDSSEAVCPEARKHCGEWKAYPPLCYVENAEPTEGEHEDGDNKGWVCKRGGEGLGGSGGSGGGSAGSGNGGADKPSGKMRIARRQSPPISLNLAIPSWLGWSIIIAAAALALMWFLKSLKDAGWESDEGGLEGGGQLTDAERNLQELPEARSSVLLKLAERSIANGDPREAAILIHLAVLRYLDDEGLVRYHPSRTNGDYLRAIRRHKPVAQLFRRVANQTERIRFGDGGVDELKLVEELDEAKRVLIKGTAEPRDGEHPSAALGATTMILLIAMAVGQTSCDEPLDPAYHSRSPVGLAALPAVLTGAGLSVEIARSKLDAIPKNVGVVVIRDSAANIKNWPESLRVDAMLDRGISVVVIDDLWKSKFFLPVTATVAHANGAIGLDLDTGSLCTSRFRPITGLVASEAVKVPYGRLLLWPSTAVTATSAASAKLLAIHPLLGYHGAPKHHEKLAALAVAAVRMEKNASGDFEAGPGGCLYVFSDRDLFTNASLTRASNAQLVAGFFATLASDGKKIMLLDRLDLWTVSGGTEGSDDPKPNQPDSPAKAMKASHMLAFIIQAAVALIALYILLGAAFGPLRDPVTREHKAFVEHVEAIGRQYAKTGIMGLTHASRALARLVVMRQRDRVRGGNAGWSGVSQHLAQKLELEEKDVRAALRLGIDGVSELGAPGPEDPSPSSDKMLRTLSRLLGGREQSSTVAKRSVRSRR